MTQPKKTIETITHFLPYAEDGKVFGGMTLIAQHTEGDSFIVAKTSLCSIQDIYSKKIGVKLARETSGIRLPIDHRFRRKMTHRHLRDTVEFIFADQ